jgi:hypothetical protein
MNNRAIYYGGSPQGAGGNGTTGPQGPAGPQGPQGPTGATGAASLWLSGAGAPAAGLGTVNDYYLNTTNSDVYSKSSGTWAVVGNIKGATGAAGTNGTNGTNGALWYTAAGAPAGGTGVVNDFYLNSTNGDYYKKTGASTWTLQGNLKGPTGATGATGATGPQGPAGPAGGGGAAVSISPYSFSTTSSGGFSNRMIAIKVFSPAASTVSRMQTFLFNTYGSQVRMGIYDLAGNLVASTLKTTIGAGLHQFFSAPLQASYNLLASTEYWLAFWSNGADLPAGSMFANLNATFPSGVHCVENPSTTDLPATISTTNPMQSSTVIIPIGAY